jgi:hypothetical protein
MAGRLRTVVWGTLVSVVQLVATCTPDPGDRTIIQSLTTRHLVNATTASTGRDQSDGLFQAQFLVRKFKREVTLT